MKQTTPAMTKKYDDRHGGPYDRGSADSYYCRSRDPHYYAGDTYQSERITQLTASELEAYHAGYDANEASGQHKYY